VVVGGRCGVARAVARAEEELVRLVVRLVVVRHAYA
jgi:hypothetical protein